MLLLSLFAVKINVCVLFFFKKRYAHVMMMKNNTITSKEREKRKTI